MAIREKKYKCGKYLEIEIYPISRRVGKEKRKRVEKNKKILMIKMQERN